MNKRRLTGKIRFRRTLFGYKIKVECWKSVCDFPGDDSPDVKVWKNAKVEDLVELGYCCG